MLTLKAGSVITIPDGFNTNGSKKFRYVEIENDITGRSDASNVKRLVYYNETSGVISSIQHSESGTTDFSGLGNCLLYRTDLNKMVVFYEGNKSEHVVSLPLMEINGDVASVVSINSVFNTCGYIGSSLFVNKGVKVLCSNGRNPDGTLNNTELELTSADIITIDKARTNAKFVILGTKAIIWGAGYSYNPDLNLIHHGSGGDNSGCFIANLDSGDSGKITSFKPYNTFHAIDYNEAVKRGGDTMSGNLTITSGGLNVQNSQMTVEGAYPAYYGKNTNLAISDTTAPSSSQFFLQLRGDDMNGEWVGCTQYYQTTGNNYMGQNVIRRKVNNVYEECRYDLTIASNGTRTANVQSDNITHNGTTIRYVKQTYINGTSWYRVWSDGWIEQGGRAVSFNTVTLPKTFKNTNYTLLMQIISGEYCMGVTVSSINANSFYFGTATHGGVHEDKPNVTCMWYACGF